MRILGLTGGIAMGKSTTAEMLRARGLPVFDADRAVHGLLGPRGGAVAAVLQAFPGVALPGGGIDRAALGARVFADRGRLRQLERILHPRVRAMERRFLALARRQGRRAVVLDIPLLVETRGQARVDAVLVAHAPGWVQWRRAMARPRMEARKLRGILRRQASPLRRLRAADAVIRSGAGLALARGDLGRALARLRR